MNLHRQLLKRAEEKRPVRVGVIGCGKFAAMYLAQAPTTPGVHIVGIADMAPDKAHANLDRVGWDRERRSARRACCCSGEMLSMTLTIVVPLAETCCSKWLIWS